MQFQTLAMGRSAPKIRRVGKKHHATYVDCAAWQVHHHTHGRRQQCIMSMRRSAKPNTVPTRVRTGSRRTKKRSVRSTTLSRRTSVWLCLHNALGLQAHNSHLLMHIRTNPGIYLACLAEPLDPAVLQLGGTSTPVLEGQQLLRWPIEKLSIWAGMSQNRNKGLLQIPLRSPLP